MVEPAPRPEDDPWWQAQEEDAHEAHQDTPDTWFASPVPDEAAGWTAARHLWDPEWGAAADLARERAEPPPGLPAAPENRDWGASADLAHERMHPPPGEPAPGESRDWGASADLAHERMRPPPDREG